MMKVFSQVSTIPGGAVKQELVLGCSYKRTAAQYLAIYIQISKPLLGSYITIGDMKKVAEPIRISPVIGATTPNRDCGSALCGSHYRFSLQFSLPKVDRG